MIVMGLVRADEDQSPFVSWANPEILLPHDATMDAPTTGHYAQKVSVGCWT